MNCCCSTRRRCTFVQDQPGMYDAPASSKDSLCEGYTPRIEKSFIGPGRVRLKLAKAGRALLAARSLFPGNLGTGEIESKRAKEQRSNEARENTARMSRKLGRVLRSRYVQQMRA